MSLSLVPFTPAQTEAIVALSLAAWDPVFAAMHHANPAFVMEAFYPNGWQVRQEADIRAFLAEHGDRTLVALRDGTVVGFLGLQVHPEDQMGEFTILAVAREAQGTGVAAALMAAGEAQLRHEGLAMIMVETGGDPGHAPARAAYEAFGFRPWPVARYFKPL